MCIVVYKLIYFNYDMSNDVRLIAGAYSQAQCMKLTHNVFIKLNIGIITLYVPG